MTAPSSIGPCSRRNQRAERAIYMPPHARNNVNGRNVQPVNASSPLVASAERIGGTSTETLKRSSSSGEHESAEVKSSQNLLSVFQYLSLDEMLETAFPTERTTRAFRKIFVCVESPRPFENGLVWDPVTKYQISSLRSLLAKWRTFTSDLLHTTMNVNGEPPSHEWVESWVKLTQAVLVVEQGDLKNFLSNVDVIYLKCVEGRVHRVLLCKKEGYLFASGASCEAVHKPETWLNSHYSLDPEQFPSKRFLSEQEFGQLLEFVKKKSYEALQLTKESCEARLHQILMEGLKILFINQNPHAPMVDELKKDLARLLKEDPLQSQFVFSEVHLMARYLYMNNRLLPFDEKQWQWTSGKIVACLF